MELYFLDLIDPRNTDLVGENDLENILINHGDRLITISQSNEPLVIGRSPNADIYIPHPCRRFKQDKVLKNGNKRISIKLSKAELAVWKSLSREHCLLNNFGRDVSIMDNKSKNGTYVEHISANISGGILLNDGDRVCLGPYCFRVIFPSEYRGLKTRNEFPKTSETSTAIEISSGKPVLSGTEDYILPKTVPYPEKDLNPNNGEK